MPHQTSQETHEQVKHFCISCGVNLSIYGGPAAACDHGLLCEICRDSSECPQCAKAEEDAIDAAVLCVCCKHGQHGSHLIGGCKCDCMCHASNQRKMREIERKPATPASATPDMQQGSK